MKFKNLLTKTLLVAAGLLIGGTSAWADSQTITLTESKLADLYPNNEVANYFDFVAMSKTWNDAAENDKTTYALATGSTTINVNKVSQYQIITPASMSMFYVQGIAGTNGFQWRWDTSKTKYGLMNFGNARTLAIAVTKGQIVVMEGGYTATTTGSCSADYAANSGYNTFTIKEDGYIAFNAKGTLTRALAILNPSASAVNYTVKYVDEEGTEIKDATEGTGDPGASITVTAAEKASFKNAGETKKYIYKSDDSEGKTIASNGSTIVTITFREAATWSYTVNAMNGETKLEELATGSTFELDNVTVPFHKYYNIDGTLYKKDAINSEYRQVVTIDEDNKVAELAYTASDKTNVVFFKEAEDIETLTATSGSGTTTRCSFAQGGYAADDAVITTLTPGKYVLTGAGYGGNLVFKAGANEVLNMATVGYWRDNTSAEFVITENTDITFKGGASGGGASLDYVIIQQTAIPAAIPASGYATIASAYPLDCANLPSGVKAYKIESVANKKAKAVEVTEAVAAGTGLILVAETADSYDIPVAATGSDISASNLLKAAVTATTLDDGTFYILKDGKFLLVSGADTEAKRTVPAGKAYLLATDVPNEAPSLTFDFGGATGIGASLVNSEERTVNSVYDLQGRKVANPTKGLYIQNGRKVILK